MGKALLKSDSIEHSGELTAVRAVRHLRRDHNSAVGRILDQERYSEALRQGIVPAIIGGYRSPAEMQARADKALLLAADYRDAGLDTRFVDLQAFLHGRAALIRMQQSAGDLTREFRR